MLSKNSVCAALNWGAVVAAAPVFAAPTTPPLSAAQTEFFESKIRPVHAKNCYKCHSAESAKVKGGLLLDTRDGLLKGGDTGPAIVAGDADKSLLVKAIRYSDPDLQMPPKGEKLNDQQIADLVTWVKMGAPDPRTGTTAVGAKKAYAKDHWSFQPVKKPVVPRVKDMDRLGDDVDAFIIAKLADQ